MTRCTSSGFPSFEEREVFRLLLSVSQVGPRLALQLLSSARTRKRSCRPCPSEDVERLVSVKGIGRKTAQRIVIELAGQARREGPPGRGPPSPFSKREEMALRALTSKSLGFSAREAREALERLRGGDLPLEELVRRALEIIGS